MIQKWFVSMAISFALRQLAKWQKAIDWAKVKEDLAVRIAALVPGEWMDQEVIDMAHAAIDAVAAVMASSEELEKIIKLVLESKFEEAWQVLKDLILGNFVPSTPAQEKVMCVLKDC